MNPMNEIVSPLGGSVLVAQRNRVLRNTYALLALSMIPTVAGAWLGLALGISSILTPGIGLIVFLVGAYGFIFAIEKNKNSAAGVPILLAFTFFMGLMLSRILQVALGFSNGGSMIALAAGGTGAIFFTLSSVAAVSKRDFTGMGKFLFAGMILILLAAVANIFFQIPALSLTIAVAAVGIFSAYILYDISRIMQGGETNYVSATLAVYLDIYNVFVSLLQLIMAFTGERD